MRLVGVARMLGQATSVVKQLLVTKAERSGKNGLVGDG
jgi:hypothetical protein